MEPPHRIADSVLDALADIPKSVSDSISSPLDRLPLGSNGPHRMLDSIVKSIPSAIQTIGEGIAGALDKPLNLVKK